MKAKTMTQNMLQSTQSMQSMQNTSYKTLYNTYTKFKKKSKASLPKIAEPRLSKITSDLRPAEKVLLISKIKKQKKVNLQLYDCYEEVATVGDRINAKFEERIEILKNLKFK